MLSAKRSASDEAATPASSARMLSAKRPASDEVATPPTAGTTTAKRPASDEAATPPTAGTTTAKRPASDAQGRSPSADDAPLARPTSAPGILAIGADPLVIRPSLRAALERFLIALGAMLGLFLPAMVGTILFGREEPLAAGALGLLQLGYTVVIPIAVSLFPALQLAFTRYILDEEGLREHVQIFTKTEKRVPWDKVTALQHRRTVMDRMLGIERLDVIAYGERGTTVRMVGLVQAPALRGLVAKQMRANASVARLFSND